MKLQGARSGGVAVRPFDAGEVRSGLGEGEGGFLGLEENIDDEGSLFLGSFAGKAGGGAVADVGAGIDGGKSANAGNGDFAAVLDELGVNGANAGLKGGAGGAHFAAAPVVGAATAAPIDGEAGEGVMGGGEIGSGWGGVDGLAKGVRKPKEKNEGEEERCVTDVIHKGAYTILRYRIDQ